MDVYALVIAGGVGSRFWPRSRATTPKQLLNIMGDSTMIQNTVARLDPLIPRERVLIVTNALQYEELCRQLPAVPRENIIVEPIGRNTAPAIALGAEILRHRVGDAVMVVLPADHIINDVANFQETLVRAAYVAEHSRGLVTIGITPTRPETGYGYIQLDDRSEDRPYAEQGAFAITTFAEKPNLETAKRFLESGDFVWNSGMFIWRVSAILNGVAEYLPEVSYEFRKLSPTIDTPDFAPALSRVYHELRGISIDYGVMEKADNRFVLPADFGWNDVGSWDEVYRIHPKDEDGNVLQGEVIAFNVKKSHIYAPPETIVAAIGVEDISIILSGNAVLVYRHGLAQDVKEIVDYLKKNDQTTYL